MSRLNSKLARRKKDIQTDRQTGSSVEEVHDVSVEESPARSSDVAENVAGSAGADKSNLIAQLQQKIDRMQSSRRARVDAEDAGDNAGDDSVGPGHSDVGKESGDPLFDDVALPGAEVENEHGKVWVNRETYTNYFHGSEPIDDFLNISEGFGALAKDKRLGHFDPSSALFIDTETTGLAGGAGTMPFLIGIGFFEGKQFVVEHLFAREPADEPAQLVYLAERVKQATSLVSFNGKSFDIPLINTRYIINRLQNPGYSLPHLDLLHVARRIYKKRLVDRSLTSLEREVLGFYREGDIPGSEIPQVYKNWLNGIDVVSMVRVLEHNSYDIVALAALGAVLYRMYQNPQNVNYASDQLGYARAAFEFGERQRGDLHATRAGDCGNMDERQLAWHLAARQAYRDGEVGRARDLWQKVVDTYSDDAEAHLRLAILFEHKEKNFSRALDHAEGTVAAEGEEGMVKRCARLQKKLEKSRAKL